MPGIAYLLPLVVTAFALAVPWSKRRRRSASRRAPPTSGSKRPLPRPRRDRRAARNAGRLHRAPRLLADQVRITYAGHSTFLIESPRLVRIATDYNDYVRPPVVPDIVTMNHAHSTHYTDHPDPAIKYVLRGWGASPDEPARHDLTLRGRARAQRADQHPRLERRHRAARQFDLHLRDRADVHRASRPPASHPDARQQLNEIGRVDVVMVPVDGSYTLDIDGMFEVLHALKAPLMIPMHYFSGYTLAASSTAPAPNGTWRQARRRRR